MKKIVMIAVMAVAAISANAQTWIGGSIGYNTNKTSVDGNEIGSSNSFEIAPEIGYKLSDNVDVAVKVGYAHASNGTVSFAGINASGNMNKFAVNPYVRYTFAKSGNFSAFVDGGVVYGTTHVSGFENNLNSFGVSVNPGIAYGISEKVSLVAHFGDLSYDHTWVKIPGADVKATQNAFNVRLFNGISFGAYYAF